MSCRDRTMFAEEREDISCEDERDNDDHILSQDDGEIDEIVPVSDISDEEPEDY